jgi:hypothetical protein
VIPVNLYPRGCHELGAYVRFFETNQICLVGHLRITGSTLGNIETLMNSMRLTSPPLLDNDFVTFGS